MIIPFAGQDVTLLPEKAIWIKALRLLVVSDLHFEKDSFFIQHSTFLPPYGSLETLKKLQNLVAELSPEIVVAAGDSFHDKGATARMRTDVIVALNQMIESVPQLHWLSGNHDPAISDVIGGLRSKDLSLGGINFRHQTISGDDHEISGHYHPKVRLSLSGHVLSAPCFVHNKNRLFLPAFGQYTGGLDINDGDFVQIAPREDRDIYIIYGQEVILRKIP